MGGQALRRSLLHCVNRSPPRPEPSRRDPRRSDRADPARWLLIIGPKGGEQLPPDLNPIEQTFSKLKIALRKGAARKVEALLRLIGRVIKTIAPEECANYFRHAGS